MPHNTAMRVRTLLLARSERELNTVTVGVRNDESWSVLRDARGYRVHAPRFDR